MNETEATRGMYTVQASNALVMMQKLIDEQFDETPNMLPLIHLNQLVTAEPGTAAAHAELEMHQLEATIMRRSFGGPGGATYRSSDRDIETYKALKALLEAFVAMARLAALGGA